MDARRLLVPLLVIVSLLIAACGGSSPGGAANTTSGTAASGAAAPASGETIQFRMAWWGSQDRHDRTINAKNVDQKTLDGGKLDGKLYAISLGTNSQSLIYDPALFEKAGIQLPSNDWTWNDFETVSTQLKDKLGTYGMSISLDDWQVYKLWLKQGGLSRMAQNGYPGIRILRNLRVRTTA